ncbi:MAG TPA: hypothetical protein VE197_01120 [Mycobacterium sp.]|nr:hypothetical protein [Mycobacterium sp.]
MLGRTVNHHRFPLRRRCPNSRSALGTPTGILGLDAGATHVRRAPALFPGNHVRVVLIDPETVPQGAVARDVMRPSTVIFGPSTAIDSESERFADVPTSLTLDAVIGRP